MTFGSMPDSTMVPLGSTPVIGARGSLGRARDRGRWSGWTSLTAGRDNRVAGATALRLMLVQTGTWGG